MLSVGCREGRRAGAGGSVLWGKRPGGQGRVRPVAGDSTAVGVLGHGALIQLLSAHPVLFPAITHQDELGGS